MPLSSFRAYRLGHCRCHPLLLSPLPSPPPPFQLLVDCCCHWRCCRSCHCRRCHRHFFDCRFELIVVCAPHLRCYGQQLTEYLPVNSLYCVAREYWSSSIIFVRYVCMSCYILLAVWGEESVSCLIMTVIMPNMYELLHTTISDLWGGICVLLSCLG